MIDDKISFGLLGYGYWGKIVARNISENDSSKLAYIVDSNPDSLQSAKNKYLDTSCTDELDKMLRDPSLDVVGIFTPPATHYDFVMKVLNSGKHALVTKPLCLNINEANEIKTTAERLNLQVFVDDTFLFSGPVKYLKKYFKESNFGDLIFIQSSRINLGLIQNDCNVIWDLAPHDIGILNYLLEKTPNKVRASGFNPFGDVYDYECHSNCELVYENNLYASITLSWLSSIKTRRMIFGGTNETIVYDHLDQDAQIKIFKQSILSQEIDSNVQFEYSIGETEYPNIDKTEPLKLEIQSIVNSLRDEEPFIANIDHAIETIRVIEGLQDSLSEEGNFIKI